MPEGDTVFLTCHRLNEALAGRDLVRGELRHPRLSTVDLAGRVVSEVRPAGKHLLMRFEHGRTLHHHLRMDGSWHLYAPGARWRRPGHQARAVLATAEQVAVGFALHDLRWIPTSRESELVGHLGPDLLSPDWGPDSEAEAVRGLTADPGREIGLALMDQRIMAGVGNLYKTEVCFLLGRSPWTPVAEVDAREAVRLSHELLLRNAWHPEQTTTKSLRRGDQHWVYGRKSCLRCGGPVRRGTQGTPPDSRTTYHCPRCQP
ncbi:DNA-formamidopyrimidine glycosylase family protein [Saccharopolyspora sp. TS4A08]|uniref:DNA-(apurinic or apyrimidinic site) lyase n=1 Tax=Saccharopolyspora ipomoeae TaxID=3042027 RepID=A0ABT6PK83_9PSEU|nr:DNA-formamidopyrimidine glycosylase family protein [Saccharopolyspora sp. TS4A08]MDI2028374.1 DNA-formamidopyrimidine glycosylase family protein [Saccharopolyspora sp. TS4A08]